MFTILALIYKTIKGIVGGILKAIYMVLSLFNLQITLLILTIGAVMFLCGVFETDKTALLIFNLLLILSIIYAIFSTVKKLLNPNGTKKSKGMQIVNREGENEIKPIEPPQEIKETEMKLKKTYPKYFTVAQNKNYVYAEYEDRYVLYKKENGKYHYVRTDFKNR